MDGRRRLTWRIFGAPVAESAGEKIPSLRNDLMLVMRRRELAEGESKMMGSRWRDGAPGFAVDAGFPRF